MKTNIGLLVGGLVLLLGATANADSLECGAVSSPNDGTVGFSQAFAGPAGSASVTSGAGSITCNAFTVPLGFTLVGITVTANDDAQVSVDSSSQITWMWSYTSGAALTPTPSGTFSENGDGAGHFAACSGTGTLICDMQATFALDAPIIGDDVATSGAFTFQVTPSVTGGGGTDGLGSGGGDSANIFISFDVVPTASVPEPASLVLMGSGLIGLGVFARRKRQK